MRRLLLIALACSLSLFGQTAGHSVGAPALGFLAGKDSTTIQPVFGIPGAARLGPALDVSSDAFFVSPGSGYVLAAQKDGELSIGLLRPASALANGLQLSPIAGAVAPDLVAFSPAGCAAAVYSRSGNTVQVLTGFPDSPRISRSMIVSDVLTRLAVSDDGAHVVGAIENGSVVSIPEHVELTSTPNVAFAFAPNANSANIFAGTGNAIVTVDGSTALVANGGRSISAVDLRSNKTTNSAVDGNAVAIRRLSAGDIYLLTFDDGSSGLLTWRGGRVFTYFIGVFGNAKGSN